MSAVSVPAAMARWNLQMRYFDIMDVQTYPKLANQVLAWRSPQVSKDLFSSSVT